MSAVDFPNSPSINDTFTVGARTWKWNGTTWDAVITTTVVGPTGPQGIQGLKGDTGATGPTGPGIATGGTIGQILSKASGTNYDTTWVSTSSFGFATTSYVDTSISNLIASAPAALDTLNELATALGNDASFATTVTNSLAGKANLTGGNSFTGMQTLINSSTTTLPLLINVLTGTTANLTEWQINGTQYARIGSDGAVRGTNFGSTISGKALLYPGGDTNGFQLVTQADANKGLVIKGFSATQSADLQQWQASTGSTLAYVSATGQIRSTVGIVAGATNYGGMFNAGSSTATQIAAIIRGAVSQTANLTEWQNSSGTILGYIDKDGQYRNTYGIMIGNAANYGATLNVLTQGAANIGAIVRGSASQTANLQEWQDSAGTRQGYVGPGGNTLNFPGITAAYSLLATTTNTAVVPMTVKGFTSQTANLQEWQNSSGTLLANVSATGNLFATGTIQTASDVRVANGVISYGYVNTYSALIGVAGGSPTTQPVLITKLFGSQTGDIQQWQDSSSNVLAKIDGSGNLTVQGTQTWYTQLQPNNLNFYRGAATYLSNSTAGGFLIHSATTSTPGDTQVWSSQIGGLYVNPSAQLAATAVPLRVKGSASQSANLQEWQDSSSTVLSKIGPSGIFDAPYVRANYAGSNQSGVRQTSPYSYLPTFTFQALGAQTGDLAQYTTGTGTSIGGRNVNAQIYTGSTSPITYYAGGNSTTGATTAASGDGTTATITVASTHGFAIGDIVTVAGVTPTGYNGTFILTGVGTNTVSYANTTTGAQTVAGTVSTPSQTSITARSAGTPALVVKSGGFVADVQRWLNSSGSLVAGMNPYGTFYTLASANYFKSDNPSNFVLRTYGSVNQYQDLFQVTDNVGTVRGAFNSYGQVYTGPSSINGPTYAITAASASTTSTATFTYNSTVMLVNVGQTVTIAGFTNETYYNGSFIITALGGVSGAYTFNVSALSAVFTVGSATQFGTFKIPAQLSVTNTSAATIGAVIKGSASQSANLTEWRNSSDSVLSAIGSNGVFRAVSGMVVNNSLSANYTALQVTSTVTTGYGMVIQGAASQSADLMQWQNSASTVLGTINANGFLTVGGATPIANITSYSYGATQIPLALRGTVSQTANLTEWQDSGSVVLAKVSANGSFYGKTATAGGYVTTNPSNTNVYQWTKFATFSMPTQYTNSVAVVDFISDGPGTTDVAHGRLFLSFKQQNPLGQSTEPPTMFLYNGYNATINDFAAVLVQNDATATRFDIYVRNNNYYQIIKFNPTVITDPNNIVFYDNQPYVANLPAGVGITVNTVNPPETEITPLDDVSVYFDGVTKRYRATYQGNYTVINNPFRLLINVNGVNQTVNTPDYVWQSNLPYDGFYLDNDGYITFSDVPQPGYTFDGRIMAGAATTTRTKNYPFRAVDLLVGA